MPAVFAARFPFDRVATPENLSIEGEDALAVGPALVRAAMGYASCRVPVRILGGTADRVVDNAMHGALAAGAMPTARFRWIAGAGRVLQHDAPGVVAAAVEALR